MLITNSRLQAPTDSKVEPWIQCVHMQKAPCYAWLAEWTLSVLLAEACCCCAVCYMFQDTPDLSMRGPTTRMW